MLLKDVADRAAAYGMPSEIVDGMDVVAVYQAAGRLVERARAGEGPSLLEAKTYRYYDHQGVKGLRIPYRTQEEIDTWKERDAIAALEERLVAADVVPADELEQVWPDTRDEIAAAIKFGERQSRSRSRRPARQRLHGLRTSCARSPTSRRSPSR